MIKYKNGNFYISDNNSKFGTLVLVKGDQRIDLGHTVAVQFGKSVLSMTTRMVPPK
jgi:hypothetical protein